MMQPHEVLGRRVQAHRPSRTWPTTRGSRPAESIAENTAAAAEILQRGDRPSGTLAEWSERFATLAGPWAPVQDTLQAAEDAADPRERVPRGRQANSNWSRTRCSSMSVHRKLARRQVRGANRRNLAGTRFGLGPHHRAQDGRRRHLGFGQPTNA